MHLRKRIICGLVLAVACAVGLTAQQLRASSSYLFIWAGDADRKQADFLAVMDADPASPTYTQVVRTMPVEEKGTNPVAKDSASALTDSNGLTDVLGAQFRMAPCSVIGRYLQRSHIDCVEDGRLRSRRPLTGRA